MGFSKQSQRQKMKSESWQLASLKIFKLYHNTLVDWRLQVVLRV